jgi:hypothetical protein
MRLRKLLIAGMFFGLADVTSAAAPVELEIVTERGVQITAPQEWVQLLAGIGIEQVRIRSGRAGDEPRIAKFGGAPASYHVVGVLTSRDQLRLPGGTFARADRVKLKDYFARLGADGADAVTAPRLRFGLTEKELTAVLADLAQPIDFETKGQPARSVLDRLQSKLAMKLAIDSDANQTFQSARPVMDELRGVSAGTSLAIILRDLHLAMRPEKPRGQPVVYRVVSITPDMLRQNTRGKMTGPDMPYWPVGWEPTKSPGETVPSLMQSLNAEIDGYTLNEALEAIRPRLKVPLFLDHAMLDSLNIDPAKIQVKIARSRMSYKRVVDRVVAQAHVGSDIRVDEAGSPFLWITR